MVSRVWSRKGHIVFGDPPSRLHAPVPLLNLHLSSHPPPHRNYFHLSILKCTPEFFHIQRKELTKSWILADCEWIKRGIILRAVCLLTLLLHKSHFKMKSWSGALSKRISHTQKNYIVNNAHTYSDQIFWLCFLVLNENSPDTLILVWMSIDF